MSLIPHDVINDEIDRYRNLCAEKEAEIGELRDQIKQWQDKFCELVKARDFILLQRDEARHFAEFYRDEDWKHINMINVKNGGQEIPKKLLYWEREKQQ